MNLTAMLAGFAIGTIVGWIVLLWLQYRDRRRHRLILHRLQNRDHYAEEWEDSAV